MAIHLRQDRYNFPDELDSLTAKQKSALLNYLKSENNDNLPNFDQTAYEEDKLIRYKSDNTSFEVSLTEGGNPSITKTYNDIGTASAGGDITVDILSSSDDTTSNNPISVGGNASIGLYEGEVEQTWIFKDGNGVSLTGSLDVGKLGGSFDLLEGGFSKRDFKTFLDKFSVEAKLGEVNGTITYITEPDVELENGKINITQSEYGLEVGAGLGVELSFDSFNDFVKSAKQSKLGIGISPVWDTKEGEEGYDLLDKHDKQVLLREYYEEKWSDNDEVSLGDNTDNVQGMYSSKEEYINEMFGQHGVQKGVGDIERNTPIEFGQTSSENMSSEVSHLLEEMQGNLDQLFSGLNSLGSLVNAI